MPKVTFRGKTYNSEFEMPEDIRHAYQEQERRKTSTKSLTDVVDMPDEVKAVYERALSRVDERTDLSRPSSQLPKTEEIYRQSAPPNMKNMPYDESVYRPSVPVIDPSKATIEPEPGLTTARLISSFVWVLILAALVYLVIQFLL